jgi:LPXTG-motif cell wall-anchored protein
MKLICHLIPLLLLTSAASAQEPKLSAWTDSSTYKIGSWILLHVDAEMPPQVESLGPAVRDSIAPFEILRIDTLAVTRDADVRHQSWTLRLTTFDSGKMVIPPVQFWYKAMGDTLRRSAFTNPVFLSITTIPFDPKGDIKDIKPPLNAPWTFGDFLSYLIALGILLLAALAYYYYRKRKEKQEEALLPSKPAVPPAQAALVALRILEEKRLWQQGKIKEYYSTVTEIVRRFLEDQFRILALESTSDEIMQQLKSVPEASPLLKEFGAFFTTADLVKFAKYEPTPAEHENELRWAYEIVRAMMPRLTAPAEQEEVEETVDVR